MLLRASTCALLLLFPWDGAAAPPPATPRPPGVERYLAAANRLYENLEYERALEQLERAKKVSTGLRTDVLISLYEGILRTELRQEDAAHTAFLSALFLDPDARLPIPVAPKVTAGFERAREEVRRQLPKLERDVSKNAALTPAPVPEKAEAPADALDLRDDASPRRSPAPFILAGTGAAAAGVGVFFGLRSRTAVDRARGAAFQDETQAWVDRAHARARTANVAFGVSAVAVATAVVLYLVED